LLSIDEVVKYFGDSGKIKNRARNPGCDWCQDEFFPWFNNEYDINRRAVDDAGIVCHWRLRSPGANRRFVANVMGWCGDEFDHGGISMDGGAALVDGHFVCDGSGFLLCWLPGEPRTLNGVRPALWLAT
jgi:hypothetical protein